MWVVKIGGSLNADESFAHWLAMLGELGGGRVTVVCGGGAFADQVRRAQSAWRFDDLAGHNMAVLAMAQTAYMAHALNPALRLAATDSALRDTLHAGQVALWLPFDQLLDSAGAGASWDVTSDSIALTLACKLNAERLVLVKSCAIDPLASLAQLGAAGVLDRRFATLADAAAFPIDVMHRADLERMRVLLLGRAAAYDA